MELKNKCVLLTGANGFLGTFVTKELISQGANVIKLTKSDDLTTEECVEKYKNIEIDYVIHLAGYNGGIAFNQTYPFDIFGNNTIMSINALKIAVESGAKKFVGVLTSCGYPPENGDNILEETYLDNKPHESISSHGYAKRNLLIACQMANKQYGLNAICVVPNTIYGPGDTIDPIRTKVMMAMIKRFVDAKSEQLNEVVCWGTGSPIREFIYVEDTAKLIVESLKSYDNVESPLNLSTGQFSTIKNLAETISNVVEYSGEIKWDISKPDGQMQKVLNTDKMKSLFPDFIPTSLETGIKNTIQWYKKINQI
jgi:GDP-L-fucose synthase